MGCCIYFLAQVFTVNGWADLNIISKKLVEVNQKICEYKECHPDLKIRVIQREIKSDQKIGRRVPKCC